MFLRRHLLATAATLAMLGAAPTAAAAILFADDFDHGQFATNSYGALTHWTVLDGSVDAFTNGGFGLPCPSLGCLDMDGSTGDAGTLRGPLHALGAGDYLLSLNVAGNQRGATVDSMSVFFGGSSLGAVTRAGFDGYSVSTFAFSLAAATSGRIELVHGGGDNIGLLLDRVELASVGTVPEPAPLALLALALAVLAVRGPAGWKGGDGLVAHGSL